MERKEYGQSIKNEDAYESIIFWKNEIIHDFKRSSSQVKDITDHRSYEQLNI